MKCSTIDSLLSPFIDGEIAEPSRVAVASHIRRCRRCAARYRQMVELSRRVRGLRDEPLGDAWQAALSARVAMEDERAIVALEGMRRRQGRLLVAVGGSSLAAGLLLGLLLFSLRSSGTRDSFPPGTEVALAPTPAALPPATGTDPQLAGAEVTDPEHIVPAGMSTMEVCRDVVPPIAFVAHDVVRDDLVGYSPSEQLEYTRSSVQALDLPRRLLEAQQAASGSRSRKLQEVSDLARRVEVALAPVWDPAGLDDAGVISEVRRRTHEYAIPVLASSLCQDLVDWGGPDTLVLQVRGGDPQSPGLIVMKARNAMIRGDLDALDHCVCALRGRLRPEHPLYREVEGYRMVTVEQRVFGRDPQSVAEDFQKRLDINIPGVLMIEFRSGGSGTLRIQGMDDAARQLLEEIQRLSERLPCMPPLPEEPPASEER